MDLVRKWLAALCLGLAAFSAAAQNGIGYTTLNTPQPTDTGKKVEVIEFFGYFCSHCYSFDPYLKEWAKKQGNHIAFKRVLVGFSPAMLPHQKLFYTLDAMGKLSEMHSRIFDTVQSGRNPMRTDEQIVNFITSQGVDRNRFLELYNSPRIASLAQAAVELQGLFGINSVPTVVIDGRYVTSPSIVAESGMRTGMTEAQMQSAALEVMDALVAKVRKDKHLDAASAKSKRR